MHSDWTYLYLARIADASERQLHEVQEMRRDLRQIRRQRREMLTLAKRWALLVSLYGVGLLLIIVDETKAKLLLELVGAMR